MINFIKLINIILDCSILFSLIIYSLLFYFEIKLNFLFPLIVTISIAALTTKLFRWYISKNFNENNLTNRSNIFIVRLLSCIFVYIVPSYYIIQSPNLVVSQYIILITLIIISILACSGLMIEKAFTK